jgi:hypothetical protein
MLNKGIIYNTRTLRKQELSAPGCSLLKIKTTTCHMNYMPQWSWLTPIALKSKLLENSGKKHTSCWILVYYAIAWKKKLLKEVSHAKVRNNIIANTIMKEDRYNILDVEYYHPAHVPKRNKYHLHEAEGLEIKFQKNINHSCCY